ncbi:MAG: TIM-barrel domain-containing protein [Pseudomonadota bacterium]
MSAFEPIRPDWSQFPPAHATGEAARTARNAVRIETSLGDLLVTLHPFGARIRMGGPRHAEYGLLVNEPEEAVVALNETPAEIVLESANHTFRLERDSLAFNLSKDGRTICRSATDGHFVRSYRLPPISRSAQGWLVHFDLASDDNIYGLGEKWGRLNKRGQLIESFNHDALGVNTEASYKNTPFAWSTNGWGVFCHTPSPVTHGVGFAPWSQRAYGLLVEDDALDLFLFSGATGAEIIGQYTELTGRAPTPPLWSAGVILSKAYYQDAEELMATAREVRARGMPCDTITLDGRAWLETDTRFSFEWDEGRYPRPAEVLRELHDMNFKVCVWEYPLVSVKSPLFAEMAERGWLLKDRITGEAFQYEWSPEPFGDVLTPLPISGLVDFTHPGAYAYWRDRHAELFAVGVDMIKADFGEQTPDDVLAHNGECGHDLHNVYAYLYNKCVYEAAEQFSRNGAFLFSRASWTGCQRFPSQWGGDPQADWEGLAASLRGGLSWGASGAPYYATDIGGFYGDKRDPKLYVRWMQAGLFAAHMRLHGIGPREPWTYGPIAEKAAMEALRLRYRLLPYLTSAIRQSSETGLPVQRAMALACPDEREAWGFDEQFFCGDDILVAPCVREDDRVSVYLPRGEWRRFPDGARYEGGVVHAMRLELSEIAMFVRAGAELPLGPDIEYTDLSASAFAVERIWTAE